MALKQYMNARKCSAPEEMFSPSYPSAYGSNLGSVRRWNQSVAGSFRPAHGRPRCAHRLARDPQDDLPPHANEPKERAAAFALAAYPAAVAGQLPIGAEAVNDLGRIAQPMLTVNGEISWQERLSEQGTTHPELASYATVLQRLGAARRERAQQLLYFCLVNKLTVAKPRELEQEFHRCVQVFGKGRTA